MTRVRPLGTRHDGSRLMIAAAVAAVLAGGACHPAARLDTRPSGPDGPVAVEVPGAPSVHADLYGGGELGVVILAHGGSSTRASWAPQAGHLAAAGFHVLVVEAQAAADLAAGRETPCLYDEACLAKDVLSGVRYLRALGATSIALIGGSMGGAAAAQASVDAAPGQIQHLVLLAPAAIDAPERIQGVKLFIATREDANDSGPRLPGIQAQYDRAGEPKRLVVLEGSAHAQRVFETADATTVLKEIVQFLRTP